MINRRISRRKALVGIAATGAASSFPAPFLSAQEPKAKIRLGVVPLISSGPIFLAQARGFFDRVNLELDVRTFADGALAIPALVAGELDATVSTANAGLFNTVARGAPFRLAFDRGVEKPGSGTMQLVVSNEMHKAGVTSIKEFAKLKGKRAILQAVGGVDHYLIGISLEKAGLNPLTDINYQPGLTYPDIVKAMGAGQCDVAQIPVPLGMIAERNNAGKMIEAGYDVDPNMQLAGWAMPVNFLKNNMSAAIRLAMVHTHAARLYNKAAAEKDPAVIKIIHDAIKVPEAIITMAAPRWTWFNEDGGIDTASVMKQGRFWQKMKLAPAGDFKEDQIFDLTPAREAAKRLEEKNPFI
jgi:NitT/TauT family transport system substrate-binding protein